MHAALQGFGNVRKEAAICLVELLKGKEPLCSYWDREDRCSYTVCKADGIDPRS